MSIMMRIIKKKSTWLIAAAACAMLIAILAYMRQPGSPGDGAPAAGWVDSPLSAGQPLFAHDLTNITEQPAVAVAENSTWLMNIESSGMVQLVNKRSGREWFSYPQDMTDIPSHQVRLLGTPVLIRYTQGSSPSTTYPYKEEGTVHAYPIEQGVRVEYTLSGLQLGFAMEYALTADGMQVTLPYDAVREGTKAKLVSLEVLPFFDGASAREDGYLMIPDGSGALIRFKEQHLNYLTRYEEFVYGGDYAFKAKVINQVGQQAREDVFYSPKEKVALPVFGMKRGRQGYAAMITQGEQDAKVTAAPSGYQNMNIYRAAAEFVYRNDDVIFLGNSNEIPMFQGDMIPGDRSVRYALLEDEQAGYVGMAKAYRSYLTEERGLAPVPQQRAALQLHLAGGVEREEILGSTYIAMTTFEQAKGMIDDLTARGVDQLEVTFESWSRNGAFGKQPIHFPAEKQLGGETLLKQLAEHAARLGIPLYLNTNYVRPAADNRSFAPAQSAIRGLNREVMGIRVPHPATLQPAGGARYYLVKPELAVNRYLAEELPAYAGLGIAGLRLDHMGDMLYSDQDTRGPATREQTMRAWTEAMALVRRDVGKVAVDYGFAYSFGLIDRIDRAPMDSSHFIYEDETIPFYSLVTHGLIPYTHSPVNLAGDGGIALLRAVEYGAAPSWLLSHESSSLLKRTPLEHLYGTRYGDLNEAMIADYKRAADVLGEAAGRQMIDHERLDGQLYRTTYDNGLRIYVNYGKDSRQVDGVAVAAYGFAMKKGE